MDTSTSFPTPSKPEKLCNELPPLYDSWLDFYDAIPEDIRTLKSFKVLLRFNREQYLATLGRVPDIHPWLYDVEVEYETTREFMLARLGEQLLHYRLPIKLLDDIRMKSYKADSFHAHEAYRDVAEMIKPFWEAATR